MYLESSLSYLFILCVNLMSPNYHKMTLKRSKLSIEKKNHKNSNFHSNPNLKAFFDKLKQKWFYIHTCII